jgi:hypothetical protein
MSDHLNRRLEALAKQIAAEKAKTGYVRVPDFPINPPSVSTQVLSEQEKSLQDCWEKYGKPGAIIKLQTADGQMVSLWVEPEWE